MPPLTGERRPVTALFADIAGSTKFAADADPEDWANTVNRVFQLMSQAVSRYGGTVAQLAGDGLLAVFGAPVAHEDDPERAVRAGLDMVASIQATAGELLPEAEDELRVRVGISTGPVVVGTVGGDLRSEYTALGDAVNVAARMQTTARPDSVLVTAETYRHVSRVVDALDLGPKAVKGKAEPVHAFEVVGLRPDVVARAGFDAPLVGRTVDLDRLDESLAAVLSGRGRSALVLGEPGIGKSRLVRELQLRTREVAGEVIWAQGRCLSFGSNLAYHLVIDIVRSLVGIHAGEHGSVARRVLDKAVEDLPSDDPPAAAELAHLLGLPLDLPERHRLEALEPGAVQARYLAALRQLVGGLSEVGPLVVVCEDVHWADTSSVELLTRLLSVVDEAPLLLIITGRPDRAVPGWRLVNDIRARFGAALVEVTLGPLPRQVARDLADTLAVGHLDHRLSDVVASKAEGNPLFVEELVRTLLDRLPRQPNAALDEAALTEIPDNLHGLLLARIDRLPEPARRLLRVAAVIGREFPAALLDEVMAQEPNADPPGRQLAQLEAAELLRRTSARPELVYAFRHALVQEAAYGSLLKSERRRLHGLVGEALERLHPQRRGELAAQLARHFEQARRPDRAAPYQLEAGEQALRRSANREALDFLEKAADHAAQADGDAESAHFRLATLLALGEARRAHGDIPTSKTTFEHAADLARDLKVPDALARAGLGYAKASDIWGADETLRGLLVEALARLGEDPSPLRARVMARLAQALYYDPDFHMRRQLIDTAVKEARHLDDDAALAEVLSARHTLGGPDDLDQQLADATLVVDIAQRIGDWDLELRGRGWRLIDLLAGGQVDAAWQEMERHAQLARRLNDPLHLRDATAWQAMRATLAGHFHEAERPIEEAYRLGHEAGDPSAELLQLVQRESIAFLRGRREEFDELEADYQDLARFSQIAYGFKLALARLHARLGQRDQARAWLEEVGYDDFTQIPRDVLWLDLLTFAADASTFVADIPRATQLYALLRPYADRFAVVDRAQSNVGSVSRSLGLLATLLGRFDEAEVHFETALDHHQRLASPPLVALTQAGYAQMLRGRGASGDEERADELDRTVHATANEFGMQLPDNEHWPVLPRVRDRLSPGEGEVLEGV